MTTRPLNYLNSKFELLQNSIPKEKIFTIEDAESALKLKRSSIYWILHNLADEKRLRRVARGYYVIASVRERPSGRPSISELAKKALAILSAQGIRFYVTGLDVLTEYFDQVPASYPPLFYIEKGSSDWAARALEKLGAPLVLNPKAGEVSIARSVRPDDRLIILRETAEFGFVSELFAEEEKAFVDVYYETTRGYYDFSVGDLAHILVTYFYRGKLNPVRMIGAARRRRIEGEIRHLLDSGFAMFNQAARPTVQLSRPVQEFIRTVRQLKDQAAHGQNR
jgi:uncharacterized protein DUF6577/putative AbiEi antitoxin of type IV toxin-antitoxin system